MIALPINITELLQGQIVEWERLEFKKGWNPEPILHTICAFANDMNNWGGGYLIVGIEEKEGRPVFPPVGIDPRKVDEIQKELIELGNTLRPPYHPVVAPLVFQERMILVIWCPGGQTRPYQAPDIRGKNSSYSYFIRRNSTTIRAQVRETQRLQELANQVPFDDRICHQAELEDLDVGLIKDFLREVRSDLLRDVDRLAFDHLCRQMQIAQGPPEYLKPLNIGLMMFNHHPEKFFPYAQIDIVEFHDEIGDSFSEKIFKGPIHLQLKEALRYLRTMFVVEEVRKLPDRAEADRFYTYPYIALEEALANAVYHKNYAQREPIEIRIKPDRIEILSFPGPLPPLKIEDLNRGEAHVRLYRNRRIGDFLKELHLTEGRCTGVPKIQKAMKKNGSPPALFQTDAEGSYFLTVLPIHSRAARLSEKGVVEGVISAEEGVNKPETHQSPGGSGRFKSETSHSVVWVGSESCEAYQPPPITGGFKLEDSSSGIPVDPEIYETYQSEGGTGRVSEAAPPRKLQKLIDDLKPRSKAKRVRSVIKKLCAWRPLTAQQLAKLLGKKDKKHLVNRHLSPMIQAGELQYTQDKNFPNQTYTASDPEPPPSTPRKQTPNPGTPP